MIKDIIPLENYKTSNILGYTKLFTISVEILAKIIYFKLI